jgi:iron complex transport system substrate-binding protein
VTETVERTRSLQPLPEVDDATRREFLIGAAGLLLLPARCGGESDEGAQSSSGDTRTVEHALGRTEVPVAPRRFMVLDNTVTVGYAASVGMLPAFALEQDLGREQPFPEDLYPEAEEIEPIPGDSGSVSLEAVAAAEPDLIIGASGYFDDTYDELSEVAPTVSLEYGWRDPWADMRLVADALGVPGRVEGARRRVDDALARAQERVFGAGRTVSFGSAWEDGSVMIYEPTFYFPILAAKRLGFEPVPDFAAVSGKPGDGRVQVSAERVGELSGDYLILFQATNSAQERAALEELMNKPLFKRLPAVERDRVLVVSRLTALGAAGVEGWLGLLEEMVPFFEGRGGA